MKAAVALCITMLAVCAGALAADNAVVGARPTANHQSPVVGRQSLDAITIPRMMSCQGVLTDASGNSVPDGDYQLTFALYTVAGGGTAFWSEVQTVTTKKGLFSTLLGKTTPIGSVPDAGSVYLAMTVSGGSELTPRVRIVSAAYAFKADTANYALASGTSADDAWVRVGSDSVLYTVHLLGIARGEAANALYGIQAYTHVNLGVACKTGTNGQDKCCCTVAGGENNVASDSFATVGGGLGNTAGDILATVAGGYGNVASGEVATVAGGENDTASGGHATVAGGHGNVARDSYATVGGGFHNIAGSDATVSGGGNNVASGGAATVAGGYADTSAASNSFTVGYHSVVPSGYTNSAAFNGQTSTASNQLRCGTLSKTGGSFTIDHPLDPYGKILNHYFVESPDMSNLYSGSVVLDAAGRGEVRLPDYFDALNRNPRVQLTGVGTSDVYVAEDISDNRFVVGGKPGAKIYWQVTGDRKDVSAEAIRRLMPVEQPKTGPLAGRMLDDDFLAGCMDQLMREGKSHGIDFRTAAGRQRYEQMKQEQREQPEHRSKP